MQNSLIKTPADLKKEAVQRQINAIMKANGYGFAPSVKISSTGISFEIDFVDVKVANPGLEGGATNGR